MSKPNLHYSALYTLSLLLLPVQLWANDPPALEVEDKVVGIGKDLNFVVVPTDDDGVVPDVFLSGAPEKAKLEDNGDGTRTFSWKPQTKGVFTLNFVVQDAQDSALKNDIESKITVVEPDDVASLLLSTANDDVTLVQDGLAENSIAGGISIGSRPGDVTKVLADLPVSGSQLSAQQTPLDVGDGYLYTVNIEPGPNGDTRGFDLRTVLRQGRQGSDQSWQWQSVVIEDRTMYNPWHTAPSVAVDRVGQLHVVYNMHNFPWQYKNGTVPHDIYSLEFNGQKISDAEIKRAVEQNRTNFPTLGKAVIPGNQITYPAFYKDQNRDLYVSYRFAAAPNRNFADRVMSSGVAIYNTVTQTWTPIGGNVAHSEGDFEYDSGAPTQAVALAGKKGWTSYSPKLDFDKQNNLFASMFWRKGIAGQLLSMPCIIRSDNRRDATDISGNPIALPVQPEQCGNIGIANAADFYSISSFALSQSDIPYMLLSPKSGSRFIVHFDASSQRWVQEKSPDGATELFFDEDNNMYAVASGIKIYKRPRDATSWEKIYDEGTKKNCYPKVKIDETGKNAFIHSQSCDTKSITVYGLRLRY